MSWPRVIVTTRRTVRKTRLIDYVGEIHLELLIRLKILPVIVPVAPGTERCLDAYKKEMDGLFLVEGEDVEPKYFKAKSANRKYLEQIHPLKDRIEINLIKHAFRRNLPVMGICRGSQLMNVVAGGTLFGDVQKEKKSHRPHRDSHHYDSYRHPATIVPNTPMAAWYGRRDLKVNSYHHQGIRDLAPAYRAMAYADDGLVEAFYNPKATFTAGFQFHPERMLPEYKGNLRVWQAFAKAIYSTSKSK